MTVIVLPPNPNGHFSTLPPLEVFKILKPQKLLSVNVNKLTEPEPLLLDLKLPCQGPG